MSLWTDFRDAVESPFIAAGDIISNAVSSVLHNPISAITSAVAMAYGIPPAWAGALGGAAGAASSGGNIIKAAITGGAMGAIGQYAGSAAASGGYGAIAQAAATGAASSVTGAVLTGQDVVTALKAGLVLGTASGGVAQLMTKQEAISSVPKDVLTQAAASNDPVGYLADKMGWADSPSATTAASEAWSNNYKSSVTALADTIPDSILKEAASLPIGASPESYIADKMGWDMNGNTTNAIGSALDDYKAGATAYNASSAGQINNIASAAGLNTTDAGILYNEGFNSTQVQNLIKLGYTGDDLVNMAGTGVTANTLTTLANTPIPEANISTMLENGVSANDIATASSTVSRGLVSVDNAQKLLTAGYTGPQVSTQAVYQNSQAAVNAAAAGLDPKVATQLLQSDYTSGVGYGAGKLSSVEAAINAGDINASTVNNFVAKGGYSNFLLQMENPISVFKLAEQGLTTDTINKLYSSGADFTKVNNVLSNNVASAADINTHVTNGNYTTWLNTEASQASTVMATRAISNTGLVDDTQASVLAHNGYTAQDVQNLTKLGYATNDLVSMASTGVPASTLTSLASSPFSEHAIDQMLTSGNVSANEIANASNLVNSGKLSVNSAQTLLTKGIDGGNALTNIANSGKADGYANLLNKGVSVNSANTLLANGADFNQLNSYMDKGYLDPTQLDKNPSTVKQLLTQAQTSETNYNNQVAAQKATEEAATLKQQQELQAQQQAQQQQAQLKAQQQQDITNMNNVMTSNGQNLGGISKVETMVDANGNQTTYVTYGNGATNRFETVAPPGTQPHDWATTIDNTKVAQAPVTPEPTPAPAPAPTPAPVPPEIQPGPLAGQTPAPEPLPPSAQPEPTQTAGPVAPPTPEPTPTPEPVQTAGPVVPPAPTVPGNIINTITQPLDDGSTMSINYYDNGDVKVVHNEIPTQPTQDQNGLNILNDQQTAEVMKNVDPRLTNGLNVDVSGVPKYAGQQGAGTPPEGFDVAKPEDVFGPNDSNSASNPFKSGTYYDAETNTWYTPKVEAPAETPNVPIVPPVETPPVVNEPAVPIATPPATEPPPETNTGGGGTAGPVAPPPVEQPPVVVTQQPVEPPQVTQQPVEQPPVVTQPPVDTTGNTVTGPVSPNTETNNSGTSVYTPGTGGAGTSTEPTDIGEITVTAPKEPPLTPPTPVVIPPTPKIPEVVVPEPPVTEPPVTEPPVTEPPVTTPIVPIDVPLEPKLPVDNTHYGTYKLGEPIHPAIPNALNPGWITNVPTHYNVASPAADKYYWGQHPYQTGSTFDPTLYNQTPNAPASPFGATYAHTTATPAQILAAMQGRYPLMNTIGVNGPVRP